MRDFTTVVRHDAPHGTSRQTVKNVLAGRSRGVFQGRIEVARAAQKTDGYQMNQALLLSPDAEIDTKPELEIFADDVKCSHGATVGELDAEQLFYLRSRGIPEAEARAILVRAFLAEALDAVTHDDGARGSGRRGRRLVGEASRMNVALDPSCRLPRSTSTRIRADFPILTQTIRGKPLVFLDSAASAQKPRAVIDAMRNAMETQYANVHRGLHWMSERTTDAYEAARDAVAALMNARDRHEIVFTRNITEAINLVAHSYGRGVLQPGQAVLISGMEHHSNIVPWQLLRDAHGIELRVAPITDAGELDMAAFEALLADGKVGLVAITHMSNVLGTYHAGGAHRQDRACAWREGAVRRRAGGGAPARRRAGAGLRFLRLDRAQAVRPHRHRRAVGAARTAGRDAAVPRRRRNDLLRHATNNPPGPRCRTSSRPARRRSWKASA